MTTYIATLAAVVAVGAAARSTWSPCGLSMLSTITPVSEQGRGHRYRTTAAWFVLGATVGGATLGAVMAGMAAAVGSLSFSPAVLGLLAVGTALVAAASDAGVGGMRLPIHRRQVNERWLDRYRPWVYGAGFGGQIGAGVATYITTAAVYLMIALAALSCEPLSALVVGTGFGLLRGSAVLLTRNVATPEQLRAFHRRFADRGPGVGRAVTALELAVAVGLVSSLRTPAGLVLSLACGAMAMAAWGARRGSVRVGEDRSAAGRHHRR